MLSVNGKSIKHVVIIDKFDFPADVKEDKRELLMVDYNRQDTLKQLHFVYDQKGETLYLKALEYSNGK